MKFKKLKRIVSGFCATIMVMSSFVTSVGATDTSEAEVAFSLKYLDSLPKKGEDNFDKFLELPKIEKMNNDRKNPVKNKDGDIEEIPIPEKEVYKQICDEVKNIEDLVDGKKPGYVAVDNSENMSREMKIAGEIYKWVANEIHYDFYTYGNIKNYYDNKSAYDELLTKPQDALFVYRKRIGVCAGKAELTALMMRIAKIPSVCIGTTDGKDGYGHAYNAIYLEENNDNRKGWTLLDSTWGSTKSDKELRESGEQKRLKEIENAINIEDVLFYGDFTRLNFEFLNELKGVNKSKLDRHEEYAKNITEICESIFTEYEPIVEKVKTNKKTLEETISEMAKKINLKISELNTQFTDIVTFKEFNIFLTDYDSFVKYNNLGAIHVKAKTQLSFAEAEKIVDKRRKVREEIWLKGFFPSFYDTKLDFKSANEKIIKEYVHKIKEFNTYNNYGHSECYDQLPYKHEFRMNGIKYQLDGKEGNSYIKLSGNDSKPAVNVKIPSDIVNLGITVKIGYGIESIYLEGDEIVDLSEACHLKHINPYNSNEDKLKEGIFSDKQIGEIEHNNIADPIVGRTKTGIQYMIFSLNNTVKICFGEYNNDVLIRDVKIPEFLTQFKIPVKIYGNIESLILERDEVVDFSLATKLKSIDVTKSKRYEKRNDKLFDTVLNEEVKLCEGVKIIDNKSKV